MKFLKVLGKILLVLVIVIAVVLAVVFGIKKYRDYKWEQSQKQKADEKAEMLTRFNYTIPDEFRLPRSGDRGYGAIDYIYEEDDYMIAQIAFKVWNKEEYAWLSDVDDLVDYYMQDAEGGDTRISQGPTEVDLNGLKATMFVEETFNELFVDNLWSEDINYIVDLDECFVVIEYNIVENTGKNETTRINDSATNACFTMREEFINSISAK